VPYERVQGQDHGDLYQMTKCKHGVESVGQSSGSDIAFVGQMSTCTCCGTMFPYIDEDMAAQFEELDRVWEPRDRCAECGGHYVRRHFGSVEFS
jgi:rRNA maturation endonuclease Nob1